MQDLCGTDSIAVVMICCAGSTHYRPARAAIEGVARLGRNVF